MRVLRRVLGLPQPVKRFRRLRRFAVRREYGRVLMRAGKERWNVVDWVVGWLFVKIGGE